MEYQNICTGIFRTRQNRFVGTVQIGNREEICHIKNTGRCRELLCSGAEVFLEYCPAENRKTSYDLIGVKKGNILFNIDSQAPNRAVGEFLQKMLPSGSLVRPEVKCGQSRFDFYIETPEKRAFLEVKGVTLEENGTAMFPDAPTQRGAKHLQELARCKQEGLGAGVLFVLQFRGAERFCPNGRTDPAFCRALLDAARAGVWIGAYDCLVAKNRMELFRPIPVCLSDFI